MKKGILYWITGLSGAGKTTIGNALYYRLKKKQDNVVLLDGDILKKIVGDHLGYSDDDRRKRAIKYAMLCKALTDQGMVVICCTIAMYDEVREWNRKNNKGYVEVFLDVPINVLQERDQKGMYSKYKEGKFSNLMGVDIEVEFPKTPDVILVNDGSLTIQECVNKILEWEVNFSEDYKRDTEYWNQYYMSKPDIEHPSLFALFVGEKIKKGKNLLELGCGNGRDSIYFLRKGIHVTAIDASDSVISELEMKYQNEDISFICDDFVCSTAIYMGQYDYCYSRFTIHAINERQEKEMLENVYGVLKSGGDFFIEVRSINDEIFGKGKKVGENAYIYQGHYRRFIKKEELENRLKEVGFDITYSEEKRGFAPYKESNPYIIRIVARKN